MTDADGKASFDLPEEAYKIRTDYMGQQFWSDVFTWSETVINVPMADAVVTVTEASVPQQGVKVYVFSDSGSYLGLYDTTDNEGKTGFRIPEGSYKFRADKGGNQYWIRASAMAADQVITVTIDIDVAPITVSMSADPESIQAGESSTLAWISKDAVSADIDNGIGAVAPNGSMAVSPVETTTYTITATGPAGTAKAHVTVTVTAPLTLKIDSPFDNDSISGPDVMVQGTVTNAQGGHPETGVTVNGISAMVYEGQFAASHVPLQEGENTITAVATDATGNSVSTSIVVNAHIREEYVRLTADTESGVAPFDTTLRADGSFSFIESSILYTGPDDVEFMENPNENEYTVRMTTSGVYHFTLEVEDAESNIYTDTISVEAMDEAELDVLLKAKWEGMKTALENRDINGALQYFTEQQQWLYEQIYTTLYENLPQIAQNMQDIELIYVEDCLAKYRIRKDELYGG